MNATPQASAQAQAVAPRPFPFPVGVYDPITPDYDQTIVPAATIAAWTAPVQAPLWQVSPSGWLRGFWLDYLLTITGGGTSATYAADGPWGGIQKMTVYDLGGEVIIQVTGYEWMVLNKFGGYFEINDPRADLTYSAANTGNVHYILYCPFEVSGRDALGTVQNESKPGWKVEIYIDSAQNTYGTGAALPTGTGTISLRLRGYLDSYTEPQALSGGGRPFSQTPPEPGSLQYWKSESLTLASGSSKFDLSNGIGFPLRNVIYYAYDSGNSTRATADGNWPDPYTILLGNVVLLNISKNLAISRLSKYFGYAGVSSTLPAADTACGRENAVFPYWRTSDLQAHPGEELRFKYIDTGVNSLVRFTGSYGGAMKFIALTNWVATPSKNRYALIGG